MPTARIRHADWAEACTSLPCLATFGGSAQLALPRTWTWVYSALGRLAHTQGSTDFPLFERPNFFSRQKLGSTSGDRRLAFGAMSEAAPFSFKEASHTEHANPAFARRPGLSARCTPTRPTLCSSQCRSGRLPLARPSSSLKTRIFTSGMRYGPDSESEAGPDCRPPSHQTKSAERTTSASSRLHRAVMRGQGWGGGPVVVSAGALAPAAAAGGKKGSTREPSRPDRERDSSIPGASSEFISHFQYLL